MFWYAQNRFDVLFHVMLLMQFSFQEIEGWMDEIRLSEVNQMVFKTIKNVFGGSTVTRRMDENQDRSIGLVTAENCPRELINSYATIGLSDYSIGMAMGNSPLGVEIIGACQQKFEKFPEIMADCASDIAHSTHKFHPGAVFKDVVRNHYPDSDMKHILFVPPFGWGQAFLTLEFPSKWVGWLMVLPISAAELKFYNGTESGELETLFEKNQIDVYDLNRKSVI
jgi:antitoxin YqcF